MCDTSYVIDNILLFSFLLLSFVDSSGGYNFPEKCFSITHKIVCDSFVKTYNTWSLFCFSFHLFDPMFIYYDFSKIVSKVAFYLFLLWIKVKIIINKNPSRKTLGFSILTIVFVIKGTVSILIPICKCSGSPKLYEGVCWYLFFMLDGHYKGKLM